MYHMHSWKLSIRLDIICPDVLFSVCDPSHDICILIITVHFAMYLNLEEHTK